MTPTHPYASGAVHSQAPSAFRPGPNATSADAFVYGANANRGRDASNIALVNGTPTRRDMTPSANGQVEMNRTMDRREQMGQGDMDAGGKGGFFSVICCR